MGTFLKLFNIVTSTMHAIQTAEEALGPATGQDKKAQVITMVTSGSEALAQAAAGPAGKEAVDAAVGTFVDGYTAIANLIGLFKHAPKTP